MTTVAAPADKLVAVIYVSSSVRKLEPAELQDILRVARERNARNQISGMLLYKDGNFLQVLEGPEAAVDALLSSIARDPRHHGMLQIVRRPVAARDFPDWSMAFREITRPAAAETTPQDGFSRFLEPSFLDDQFRASPSACYKLLLKFKDSMR